MLNGCYRGYLPAGPQSWSKEPRFTKIEQPPTEKAGLESGEGKNKSYIIIIIYTTRFYSQRTHNMHRKKKNKQMFQDKILL